MDFKEFGLQLKQNVYPGVYDDIPDDMVAQAFLEKHPEYWDMVSPAARKIHDLMKRDNKPSYSLLVDMFTSDRSRNEDQAAISRSGSEEAAHLHDMELRMAAVAAGMTLNDYSTAQLEAYRAQLTGKGMLLAAEIQSRHKEQDASITMRLADHQADTSLKVEREKASILLERDEREARIRQDVIRADALQKYRLVGEIRANLFAAYDERHRLESSDDPVKGPKLEVLNKQIELLEKDFYGGVSRQIVAEGEREYQLGAVEEEPDAEGNV